MGIAILGADGQLGQEFCRLLGSHGFPVPRSACDITNEAALRNVLQAVRPKFLLNCAAYTRVDQAESDVAKAFLVNSTAVRELANLCRDLDCTLVHFSTNYVFGKEEARVVPYVEDDVPGPINVYGASKLAGETYASELCPKHFVVRTSGLYGRHGKVGRANFVDTLLRKGAQGQTVRVVNDQVCTPTATHDLARAVMELIATEKYGFYHLTNGESCTWFQFTQAIFELASCLSPLVPIRSEENPVPAKRPLYSVLENRHWLEQGHSPLRPWRTALEDYLLAGTS